MRIVRLEEASAGRCFIHLEDGNSFPLGRKESRQLELSEGKDLTEDQIKWIYEELVFPRGRNYLIYLLAARDLLAPDMDKNCCFRPLTPSLPRYDMKSFLNLPVFFTIREPAALTTASPDL